MNYEDAFLRCHKSPGGNVHLVSIKRSRYLYYVKHTLCIITFPICRGCRKVDNGVYGRGGFQSLPYSSSESCLTYSFPLISSLLSTFSSRHVSLPGPLIHVLVQKSPAGAITQTVSITSDTTWFILTFLFPSSNNNNNKRAHNPYTVLPDMNRERRKEEQKLELHISAPETRSGNR